MKKAFLPGSLLFMLALLFGVLIYRGEDQIGRLKEQHKLDVERVEAARLRLAEEQLTQHRQRMSDLPLVTGKRALEKHEEEWTRRAAYDPSFALTKRERTILEIVSLSKDKSLAAEDLLQRIATLAAPKGSNIDVAGTPRGYHVEVKFDMSVMTSGEHGSSTKHTSIESLKREVVEIISRVSKDMYDHCGNKGIDRISVACTHGVRESSFGLAFGGRTVTKTIYRCAITARDAKRVADWRRIPLHKIADMLKVEHNEFPYLRIVTETSPGFGW